MIRRSAKSNGEQMLRWQWAVSLVAMSIAAAVVAAALWTA